MDNEKYNEALEKAKMYHKNAREAGDYSAVARYENIFPELRESESEDERMIRKIKSFLSAYDAYYFKNDEWREIEVWLEKQKTYKPTEEDERIRKKCMDFIRKWPSKEDRDECLAWLEKQKYDRLKPIYDARESFESALEKAWNDYHNGYENVDKLEDDYVECAHAKGFREGYLFGIEKQKEVDSTPLDWNDYKDKPIEIWNAYIKGKTVGIEIGKQKEQKPVQSEEEKEYVRIIKSLISDFIRGKEDYIERGYYQKIYDWLDGRHVEQKLVDEKTVDEVGKSVRKKWALDFINYLDANRFEGKMSVSNAECKDIEEAFFSADWEKIYKYYNKYLQKPVEKQDYSGLNDLERAILRGFLCAGVENVPVTIIKETEKDCLAHLPVELPVEWSEEDTLHLTNAILSAEKEWGTQSCTAKWLEALPKRFILQPKQEWSEEDEAMIGSLINYFEGDALDYTAEEIIAWLKSLPLRPKKNISKTKSKIILALHHATNCTDAQNAIKKTGVDVADVADWLFEQDDNSSPQWKPSEEQVEAVRYFVNRHQSEAWAATGQWKQFTVLRGLLGILQKLL